MKKWIAKLWSWLRFKKLSTDIKKEYMDKWMSEEKAEDIWRATAAKIWIAKYWKKKMMWLAQKWKK